MQFLADESCDFSVVRALRAAGHDVAAVAEIAPRADDAAVVQMALSESRVLLTEDRDFGRLVYAEGRPSSGVVLIRFPAAARATLPDAILSLVQAHGQVLEGCFVVVSPTRFVLAEAQAAQVTWLLRARNRGPAGPWRVGVACRRNSSLPGVLRAMAA